MAENSVTDGPEQPQGRPVGRRRLLRRSAIALAAVVIAAGVGVGIWQAVEHLRQPSDMLVPSDAVESTEGQASGVRSLGWQVPRSVSGLKLADIWEEVATRLGVDPGTARLHDIGLDWDADGLVYMLLLRAGTPDGRDVTMSAFSHGPDTDAQLDVRGSTSPSFLGRLSDRVPFGGSAAPAQPIFVGVEAFLAALDRAGLMEIAAQSGLDIGSDPAESLESNAANGALGPEEPASPGQAVNKVLLTLQWTSRSADQVLTSAEQLTALEEQGVPVYLSIDGRNIERLDAAQLSTVPFPALCLGLSRQRLSIDETEIIPGGYAGTTQACPLLIPWPQEGADDKTIAEPVDERLDGLAFTTPERDVRRIRGGAAQTLWESNDNADSLTAIMHPSASYGVSYSLGKTLVLRGGGIVQTTTGPTDAAGSAEGNASVTDVVAVAIPVDDPGASWGLLRFSMDEGGQPVPAMNRVVFDESGDRLWLSQLSSSTDETKGPQIQQVLRTAQPHTSGLVALPLGHPFGGDFAVSRDGSAVFYIGFTDGDAAVTLRTGDVEQELSLGLATAYHPVFSPDGSKICLVGSKKADGEASLWLYDLKSEDCRQIKSTEGLTPTYPAFSPDGLRIAFRNFNLGDVWTVTVEGVELTRYALTTEEAPIAW